MKSILFVTQAKIKPNHWVSQHKLQLPFTLEFYIILMLSPKNKNLDLEQACCGALCPL